MTPSKFSESFLDVSQESILGLLFFRYVVHAHVCTYNIGISIWDLPIRLKVPFLISGIGKINKLQKFY